MKKRDILFFGGCAAVAAALLLTVDIQTPAEYYAAHPTAITEDGAFIELRVDSSAVPDGGVILDGRYALAEGDSVFDVVERVLRAEGISLDYSGGRNIYVDGINGVCELDYGAQSGWIYKVNGTAPDINCGEYQPVSGDDIEFVYVTEYYGGGR